MWEILIILLLIVLNGFFALSEMAIVSSRRTRLQQMTDQNKPGAKMALTLNDNPSSFLSTVQVGITLIGILAGAYGGATIAENITPHISTIPVLAPHAHVLAMTVVVVVITFLSLILGELVPKRIALVDAEFIAAAIARPMSFLAALSKPFVWILGKTTDGILRLIGLYGRVPAPVTEEEVKALIEEGTQTGIFEPVEREMIDGVLRLADRTVRSIMTPRPDIMWIDADDPPDAIYKDLTSTHHSRFLVSQEGIDNILGVVHAKDLLSQILGDQKKIDVRTCLEKPLIVHDGTHILKLLELFRNSGQEMAIVVDEYGGLEGIVTVTDILETIAGALPETGDAETASIIRREDGSWLVEGLTPIDEVERTLDLKDMKGRDDTFNTLAGFIMHRLGHVPKTGERFIWRDHAFEIVDMDGRRVDQVIISTFPHSKNAPSEK